MPSVLFSPAVALVRPPADPDAVPPPPEIRRAPYRDWLQAIRSHISAFLDKSFDWYETQLGSPLPEQVTGDPDKLYVDVATPLNETIALEEEGSIDVGNTVGFNVYGLVDVPISTSLEAYLFYCGKPVGKSEGETYPLDTVFSSSHCSIAKKWGEGNFLSMNSKTGGGIVQSLNDNYTILVRQNVNDGLLAIFANFLDAVPDKESATDGHISITLLKSAPTGGTEFRQFLRRNGQSYRQVGLDYGRKTFGFNAARIRQAEKAFTAAMIELKTTGKIKEGRH